MDDPTLTAFEPVLASAMPFDLTHIFKLLQDLEAIYQHDPRMLKVQEDAAIREATDDWFGKHRRALERRDTNLVAVLSCLFPERRTDRVYNIQVKSLKGIVCRSLFFSHQRRAHIDEELRTPGKGDLGAIVERVQQIHDVECLSFGPASAPMRDSSVSVDEVDSILQRLAAVQAYSSPQVRATKVTGDPRRDVGNLFLRLRSWEMKWLIRMILKDYGCVVLNEMYVLRSVHFLLPHLLQIQDTFPAAVALLEGPCRFHSKPDDYSAGIFVKEAIEKLKPCVGVSISRHSFTKARVSHTSSKHEHERLHRQSINHCVKMAGCQEWMLEWKYDGEYCQFHIDLGQKQNPIRVFSKSGKDSTEDRRGYFETLRDCLRIGQSDCGFRQKCILVGEMVVWSGREKRILEFCKIRKYITRSGRCIGTENDSQQYPWDQLMVVFNDVLLVDDLSVGHLPLRERRKYLKHLVTKRAGKAMTSKWKTIDFATDNAEVRLMKEIQHATEEGQEGLVLKPADAPYFRIPSIAGSAHCPHWIKVKKDLMQDFKEAHDEADFVVVGASYDPQLAEKFRGCISGKLRYTTFFLACLVDPVAVRFDRRRTYKIVGAVNCGMCIPVKDLQYLNGQGQFYASTFDGTNVSGDFNIEMGCGKLANMQVIFSRLFVVEVLGSSYDKDSGQPFWMLRFPRIRKIHHDRSSEDCITFEKLQEEGEKAERRPCDPRSVGLDQRLKNVDKDVSKRVTKRRRFDPAGADPPSTLQARSPVLMSEDVGSRNSLLGEEETTSTCKKTSVQHRPRQDFLATLPSSRSDAYMQPEHSTPLRDITLSGRANSQRRGSSAVSSLVSPPLVKRRRVSQVPRLIAWVAFEKF